MTQRNEPGGDVATRLFFSRDVLVMAISIIGRYPSVNHVGADGRFTFSCAK